MAIDLGAVLDKTIDAYSKVSEARIARDSVKYQTQGATQARELHDSEALTSLESYATGNAKSPAAGNGYFSGIPKPLLYGSVGLLVGALALKVLK